MRPRFPVRRFKIDSHMVLVMYVLICRESGLDCDFVIKGETKEEFLKNGASCDKNTWYARRRYLPKRYPCESVMSFIY